MAMSTWKQEYNVSGTIHCELDQDLMLVMRDVIQTEIGMIGHMTGMITLGGASEVAHMMATGRDTYNFIALVPGERSAWLQFGERLEAALTAANLPYSLVVHPEIHYPT
jgi:hypothetical protein